MKMTVQIPDTLLEEARKLASREGTTVGALVEEGVRKILGERKRTRVFRLRRASFRGDGLQPELAGVPWERIREMGYEGPLERGP